MPTRVITGGVEPLPGATMLERKLWFEARGRRPAAPAHARAARPRRDVGRDPPAADAPGRRLGRALHRGLRAACRCAGTARSASPRCSWRRGMVAVSEPETLVRLDTPAGLVEARVAVRDGRARAVTLRNVPSFLLAADREVEVPGLGRVSYDMAFGGNFYALLPAADVGLAVEPGPVRRPDRARAGDHGGRQRRRPPGPPRRRPDRRLRARRVPRAGPRRRGRARRDRHPSRAGSTARRAGPARPRGWPSCMRAARWRSATRWSTNRRSARASRGGSRRRPRSPGGRRSCPRSPAAPG